MNLTKQTRDGLLLGGALLLLTIVAVFTFKGGDNTNPPPAAAPTANSSDENAAPATGQNAVAPHHTARTGQVANARGSATALTVANADASATARTLPLRHAPIHAVKSDTANPLAWVRSERLPNLIAEVRGGRDPFKDLRLPPPAPPASSPIPARGDKVNPLPLSEPKVRRNVPLDGVELAELQKAYGQAGLAVTASASAAPGIVTLAGTKSDLMHALDILKEQQALAIPPFVLVGVMVMNGHRNYALITAGNKQYGVYEGESLPDVGWTVHRITSTGVMLVRGTQNLQLRLAGGKVS